MSGAQKTLIIARHGNTFGPGDTPTRVGARTDLALVESGVQQARLMGTHLRAQGLLPEVVYASPLQRTQETARIVLKACGLDLRTQTLEMLREVDYGPDENQTEEVVIARIGAQALKDWDERAVVPTGWLADPARMTADWMALSQDLVKSRKNVFLAVTSNGVARFAPHITGDFEGFRARFDLKLKTGAYGVFKYEGGRWFAESWNVRPGH
jgi:2,3-bisphosphoglycerate-dependent phosphoglycerate mutase